ncbi:DUF2279 domain-containing protein [Desulforhopalus singaporensis]|uniref:Predicted lipoprotein n=1 Tax=Desulforhopalus singaporensis TaxID=91360 RepID=A0A1H0TNM0_9BACT|nr:DUF2279 domain-containing protein [Desulforhopalus singaporensis]SDP55647.1 Predicted lipoprotein [Desulforhopalus singaporensis]
MKVNASIITTIVVATLICVAPLPASDVSHHPEEKPAHPATSAPCPNGRNWWTDLDKEKKLLYTNIAAASVIGLWGMSEWDYGSIGWYNANEGWFEQDTKYGGADKVGHFWISYALADGLSALYKSWEYDQDRANRLALVSSWTIVTAMELMDATSETQGFAWEDIVMNSFGVLASAVMHRWPGLDRKIDFRIEYVFNEAIDGFITDYSNIFYSIVVKPAGFDYISNNIFDYLELHGGYYTRGYTDNDDDRTRSFYVGIGINFSKLFQQSGWHKTAKVLEYLQPPYTVPKASADLSR